MIHFHKFLSNRLIKQSSLKRVINLVKNNTFMKCLSHSNKSEILEKKMLLIKKR
jgi:hypothetical protein